MRIYIETLGCPKNEVDSKMAEGMLINAGYEIADNPDEADIIMVNTCAFINDAKTESIDTILNMGEYKKHNCKMLIVSGCLSQRYKEELFNIMPEADLMIGVNDYAKLPELIKEAFNEKRGFTCSDTDGIFEEFGGITSGIKNSSAYLKIAEGCNNRCTYCIIPYIRGEYRSRKKEDIIEEAKKLAAKGAKEFVLIAQDVTNYGYGLYDDYDLADLLSDLKNVEGIKWIRLMYCYPDKITDKLIAEIRDNPKVCKYIDMPVQHGSDVILKAMNRKSRKADIERVVRTMQKEIPDIVIRTTLIVGFPGEKAAEFNELYDFVEDMKFDRLGVFSYSKEEGTPAALIKPQVRSDVKERRQEAVMQLQQSISLEKNLKRIGDIYEVLVEEGPDEEGAYLGRTQYDAAEIDNGVIFTSDRLITPGEFVKVKITDAFDYDLVGEAL